ELIITKKEVSRGALNLDTFSLSLLTKFEFLGEGREEFWQPISSPKIRTLGKRKIKRVLFFERS
ncbi:hypothetical protein, partial [Proteus mirabilis]|uniref:hypothetical protein n=1 Tax=Proteus mirabilis TaxID=584 RepID=UPI001C12F68E